jgi:hypothetical protein
LFCAHRDDWVSNQPSKKPSAEAVAIAAANSITSRDRFTGWPGLPLGVLWRPFDANTATHRRNRTGKVGGGTRSARLSKT